MNGERQSEKLKELINQVYEGCYAMSTSQYPGEILNGMTNTIEVEIKKNPGLAEYKIKKIKPTIKVGLDLHKTLDKFPKKFETYIDSAPEWVKFFVISGSPKEEMHNEIDSLNLGIKFDGFISVVDFVKDDLQIPMWEQESPRNPGQMNWYCNDDIGGTVKSIICKKNDIDFMLDDKSQYQMFFGKSHPTKFILGNGDKEFPKGYVNFFNMLNLINEEYK